MEKDDTEKLEKFIKLLPEQAVEDFLNKILLTGKFTEKDMVMFSDYDVYSAEILSQFTNPKINAEWETFNASLNSLQKFIQEHYTLPNGFYTKHSVEWDKNIDELKTLGQNFEEKYRYFIISTKTELENKKLNNKGEKGGNISEEKLHISYNTNLGQLILNEDGLVELEGKQKDVAECLVKHGKDVKVSWDEIYEQFKDSVEDEDIPNRVETDKRKRSVRTAITEINNHTKEYLGNKELIGAKDNEYWLQHEVDKGR